MIFFNILCRDDKGLGGRGRGSSGPIRYITHLTGFDVSVLFLVLDSHREDSYPAVSALFVPALKLHLLQVLVNAQPETGTFVYLQVVDLLDVFYWDLVQGIYVGGTRGRYNASVDPKSQVHTSTPLLGQIGIALFHQRTVYLLPNTPKPPPPLLFAPTVSEDVTTPHASPKGGEGAESGNGWNMRRGHRGDGGD